MSDKAKGHMIGYHLDTAIKPPLIEQVVSMDFGDVREEIYRQVLNTADAQVRAALIKMGWTPPMQVGDTIEITHDLVLWGKGQRGIVTRLDNDGVMAAFNGEADWYVAAPHFVVVREEEPCKK